MTKEEIEKEIKRLELRFYILCQHDNWTFEEWDNFHEIEEKLQELYEKLDEKDYDDNVL